MSSQISPLDKHAMHAVSSATDRRPTTLRLVRAVPQTREAVEQSLPVFDPDDDLLAIIPMPPTIPAAVRTAITRALGHRFEFADELDEWLHAPNEALAGATPFERVVDGDGLAMLRALGASGEFPESRESIEGCMPEAWPALRLLR